MVAHSLVTMALLSMFRWSQGSDLRLQQDRLEAIPTTRAVSQASFSNTTIQTILSFQLATTELLSNTSVFDFEQGTFDFFQSVLSTVQTGLHFQVDDTTVQSQLSPCGSTGGSQQSDCFIIVDLLVVGASSEPLADGDALFGKLLLGIVAINPGDFALKLSEQSNGSLSSVTSAVITSNATLSPSQAPSSVASLGTTSLQSPQPTSTSASNTPSDSPSLRPSPMGSESPSAIPTQQPSRYPSLYPSLSPSLSPSLAPSYSSQQPSHLPSTAPTVAPSLLAQNPSVHTADITIQLLGMDQLIPTPAMRQFDDLVSNFVAEYFPTIQGYSIQILSVTITSQALSNRRLDDIVLRREMAVASNFLLVRMNVTGAVVPSSSVDSDISDGTFHNLVSQIFQSHFDAFTTRLAASSNVYSNVASSNTAKATTTTSSKKTTSTFAIVLAVTLGALAALAVVGVIYIWRRRQRYHDEFGVPKEVHAIPTSSTKELEFDTSTRSIPNYLEDVHSLDTLTRHRGDISVMSDNFDSSDCEQSSGSVKDDDSDTYGDGYTDAGSFDIDRVETKLNS